MEKFKFTKEFEFKASAKMLYPYISTAQGLSEWFVSKVSLDKDKNFHFEWQGENLTAKLVAHKLNSYVKFEFTPKTGGEIKSHNYLEFRLNSDELTLLTYLKVTDYSEMDDEAELNEMWEQFVATLRSQVGG